MPSNEKRYDYEENISIYIGYTLVNHSFFLIHITHSTANRVKAKWGSPPPKLTDKKVTCKKIRQSFTDVCELCVLRYEHFHFLLHKNMQWNFTERRIHFFWLNGYWKSSHKQLFLLGKQNYDKMIRPIWICNLL